MQTEAPAPHSYIKLQLDTGLPYCDVCANNIDWSSDGSNVNYHCAACGYDRCGLCCHILAGVAAAVSRGLPLTVLLKLGHHTACLTDLKSAAMFDKNSGPPPRWNNPPDGIWAWFSAALDTLSPENDLARGAIYKEFAEAASCGGSLLTSNAYRCGDRVALREGTWETMVLPHHAQDILGKPGEDLIVIQVPSARLGDVYTLATLEGVVVMGQQQADSSAGGHGNRPVPFRRAHLARSPAQREVWDNEIGAVRVWFEAAIGRCSLLTIEGARSSGSREREEGSRLLRAASAAGMARGAHQAALRGDGILQVEAWGGESTRMAASLEGGSASASAASRASLFEALLTGYKHDEDEKDAAWLLHAERLQPQSKPRVDLLRQVAGSFPTRPRLDQDVCHSLRRSVAAMRAHIAHEEKPAAPGEACRHVHLEYWGGAEEPWHCKRCKAAMTSDHARIASEEEYRLAAMAQDGDDPEDNADRCWQRGVGVKFLVAFSFAHDCWAWPTWQVVRDIIGPATQRDRCRYADLPECCAHAGPATVFASHCWGAPWGDLMAAVCCGARQDRRVWLDVFAVRQWPGNSADLDFRGVIRRCPGFLLASTSLRGVSTMRMSDIWVRGAKPSGGDRRMMASYRVWCLVELGAALQYRRSPLLRAGYHILRRHGGGGGGSGWCLSFVPDEGMLEKMMWLVDVRSAEATVPADRISYCLLPYMDI